MIREAKEIQEESLAAGAADQEKVNIVLEIIDGDSLLHDFDICSAVAHNVI